MVEPQNEFTVASSPTVPDNIEMKVIVNHDFSETIEREPLNVGGFGNGELHNLVSSFCKLQSHNVFDYLPYFHLFYTYCKATYQPGVNGSQNLEFILEKNLSQLCIQLSL